MKKKIFDAKLADLSNMIKWIRSNIQLKKIDEKQVKKIELACEEALVNIISYAYPKEKGKIEINIDLSIDKRIEITIIDQGIFFNPLLEEREINPGIPLEERSIGGLGIVMIKQVMDEVHYNRQNSSNVLKLIKKNY